MKVTLKVPLSPVAALIVKFMEVDLKSLKMMLLGVNEMADEAQLGVILR